GQEDMIVDVALDMRNA
ncbi:hypothetical protein A167_02896, partial [Alcanivorax sp. S71-1-4]